MPIYTDRIVLVFPIAAKNRPAAASLQTLEVTESGKEFESVIPLDPALVADYASEFNVGLLEQVESLTTQLAAVNARIEALSQELPFNPRIIDASKFYDRLSKDEILTLFSSADPTTKTIAETILAYKTNDWPVVFESPEFQQMLGYLIQSGTLTEARMAELTRDATRAEAYDAE